MKVRKGFVSNSSSTSFVIDTTSMPKELLDKIKRMTDRTFDCSRCTGIIYDISEWASEFDGEYDSLAESYSGKKGIVMIRESDEEMGGYFGDYGFCEKDIKPFVLYEFEFH